MEEVFLIRLYDPCDSDENFTNFIISRELSTRENNFLLYIISSFQLENDNWNYDELRDIIQNYLRKLCILYKHKTIKYNI